MAQKNHKDFFIFSFNKDYKTTLVDMTFLFKIKPEILDLKNKNNNQIMNKFIDLFREKTPTAKNLYYGRGKNVLPFFVYDSSIIDSKKVFNAKKKIVKFLRDFNIQCEPRSVLAFNTDKNGYLQKWFDILKKFQVDEIYLHKMMKINNNHKIFLTLQRVQDLLRKGASSEHFFSIFKKVTSQNDPVSLKRKKNFLSKAEKNIQERVDFLKNNSFYSFMIAFDIEIEKPKGFSFQDFMNKNLVPNATPEQVASIAASSMKYLLSISKQRYIMVYPEIELL